VTINENRFIEVGSVGWQHAEWIDSYYPDELPDDWLFSFYSKEFQALLITEAELNNELCNLTQGKEIEWLSDIPDEFEFYVELNPSYLVSKFNSDSASELNSAEFIQQLIKFITLLGSKFRGLVVAPTVLPSILKEASVSSLDALIGAAVTFAKNNKVCIYLPELSSTQAKIKLSEQFMAEKTDGEEVLNDYWLIKSINDFDRDKLSKDKVGQVLIIDLEQFFPDLRQLGRLLQKFKKLSTCVRSVIFFKGKPPSIKLMKQTQAVISLL